MKALFFAALLILCYLRQAQAASNLDLTFIIGPSMNQSGGIEDLGEPEINTGIGFNYFIKPAHGIGFSYSNESTFDGTKELPSVRDASINTLDLHYAYRYITKRIHLVFEPGFGVQTLYNKASDSWGYSYYDPISTGFILNYKLFGRFIVMEWDAGEMTSSGNFFLGVGIIQNFSSNDDYNGKDISGSRLASVFQIGVGW
jgi:hypothetical protein